MNEITYNGKNLSDFGVYYDSHSAFGSPERDVELVEVAGKNGALIIDNDRFRNIDLTFPCYINTNFLAQYRNALAYLQSCKGYSRLEYTQEPNHFRMASFDMGSQPTPNQLHRSGQFPVVFNCKPQRFLKSGETPVSSQSQDEEYEGNPVSINNPSGLSTVKSLEVGLSPIQNLNGYDSPWVGGAGVNKAHLVDETRSGQGITSTVANEKITATGTASTTYANLNYLHPISITNGQQYTVMLSKTVANNIVFRFATDTSDSTYQQIIVNAGSTKATFTANNNYGLFRVWVGNITNGTVIDISDLQVLVGEGTVNDWSPYSNICPISGHTEVNVVRTGKNLLDISTFVNKAWNGTSDYPTRARSTHAIYVPIGTQLTFSCDASFLTTYRYSFVCMDSDFPATSLVDDTGWQTTQSYTRTALTNYIGVNVRRNDSGSIDLDDLKTHKLMVEVGSTATDYVPFADGTTYTSSLGTTVYGGSLDIVSGVLTVTHGFKDLGDCSWTYYGSGFPSLFYTDTLKTLIGQTGGNYTHGICSCYKMVDNTHNNGTYGSDTAQPNGSMRFRNTDGRIYIVDERFTDATALTSALSGETVVFELHDPVTYNLTPTQVSLLTGVNVITTDGNGDMTVTVTEPTLLVNPTLFESKPLLRIYGTGTVNINDQYITISAHSFPYIDIDCELMDAYYGSSNANQYVTFSDNDYITLKSGNNYIAYGNQIEVTPRWYEI